MPLIVPYAPGDVTGPAVEPPRPGPPLSLDRPARLAASDWPRTNRVIPWLVAGFLVMLWLVPFDGIGLPISLPVDSKPDRFFMLALTALWLATSLAGGLRAPVIRGNGISGAFLACFVIAGSTIVVNLVRLEHSGEFGVAVKKLSLLASFGLFFFIMSTSLREREARALVTLTIVLATVSALGTIYEFRSGTNLFYSWTVKLLPPGATFSGQPIDPQFGRPAITGPTGHGLALCSMLGMALSLGLVRVLHEPNARRRLWYGVACVVIGAGALATQRKTAMVAPVAAFLVLLAYRPQSARRLAPLAVVVVVVAQIFVPGALHNLKAEFLGLDKSNSTSARAADYEAVKPDVLAKPMLGRGFGSYDPHVYRYLDNQILMLVIEVGAIGTLSYLLIFGVAQLKAGPIIRRGPPLRAELALGAAAGIGAYVVSNLLFDVLAFRQVPYVMCFLLAVVAIAAREETSGQRLDVDRPLL